MFLPFELLCSGYLLVCLLLSALLVFPPFEMLHHPFYAWCRHKCKNSPPAVRWIRAGIELLVCLLLFALLVFLLFEMLHQWSFLLKCFTSDPSFELLHQWSFFLKSFTSDPSFEMLHQWSFFLKCFTSDPSFWSAMPLYFLPLSKAVSIGFQTVSCFAWLMVTFTAVIGACT